MKVMPNAKSNQSGCCAHYAAAGAFADQIGILGTVFAAVSVFVAHIIGFLVWKG